MIAMSIECDHNVLRRFILARASKLDYLYDRNRIDSELRLSYWEGVDNQHTVANKRISNQAVATSFRFYIFSFLGHFVGVNDIM